MIISANEKDKSILDKLGSELHFVFISSQASVIDGDSLLIQIDQMHDEKCTRCWHRDSSVGQSKDHPEICSRCEENIDELGESRSFV